MKGCAVTPAGGFTLAAQRGAGAAGTRSCAPPAPSSSAARPRASNRCGSDTSPRPAEGGDTVVGDEAAFEAESPDVLWPDDSRAQPPSATTATAAAAAR